jgi:hypothetical protein
MFIFIKSDPQMKFIITIVFLFSLFSCTQTKKEDNTLFIPKNNFIVSVFHKKLDSLAKIQTKKDSSRIILNEYDKKLNKNYLKGYVHFLIIDNHISFYALDTLRPKFLMCGNKTEFSEQDSIRFIRESNKLIDILQPIKTSEIIKILKQNQDFILNKEHNTSPLNVSFALKNDTLKGSTMYNIISFMENNGMKSYTIRRMNDYELTKTK